MAAGFANDAGGPDVLNQTMHRNKVSAARDGIGDLPGRGSLLVGQLPRPPILVEGHLTKGRNWDKLAARCYWGDNTKWPDHRFDALTF